MSEKVQIQISQTGASSVIESLNQMAKAAQAAHAQISKLNNISLGNVNLSKSFSSVEKQVQSTVNQLNAVQQVASNAQKAVRSVEAPTPSAKSSSTWNSFFDNLGKRAQKLAFDFRAMDAALIGVSGAIAARLYTDVADKAQNLKSAIEYASGSSLLIEPVMDRLFTIAKKTYMSMESVEKVYLRTSAAAKEFGLSQREVLNFTEQVALAGGQSFATVRELNNALLQFSQAISSNRLGGEEYRSVTEQARVIADVLRKYAKDTVMSMDELKTASKKGELTTKVMIDAFKKAFEELQKGMEKIKPTIEKQLTNLGTNWMQFLATDVRATKFYQSIVTALGFLNDNFSTVMRLIAAGGLSTAIIVLTGLVIKLGMAILSVSPFTALVAATSILIMFSDKISQITINGIQLGIYLQAAFNNPMAALEQLILKFKELDIYAKILVSTFGLVFGGVFVYLVGSAIASIAMFILKMSGIQLILTAVRGAALLFSQGLLSISSVMIGSVIPALLKLPLTILRWIGVFALANPMFALVVGASLLAVLAIENDWIELPPALQGVWDSIVKAASNAFDYIRDKSITTLSSISRAIANTVGGGVTSTPLDPSQKFTAYENVDWSKWSKKDFDSFVNKGKPVSKKSAFDEEMQKIQDQVEEQKKEYKKLQDEQQKLLDAVGKPEGKQGTGDKKKKGAGRGPKTFDEYYTNIQEEGKYLNLGQFDRDVGKKRLEVMKGLRRELTDEENKLIYAALRHNEILKKQGEIYDSIRGPAETYKMSLEALNLDKQRYTTEEYTKKLKELRIAFLDTKTDFASGVQRGLDKLDLEKANEATKIEQALTNVVQDSNRAYEEYSYGLKAVNIARQNNMITTEQQIDQEQRIREAYLATKKDKESGYQLAQLRIEIDQRNEANKSLNAYTSLYNELKEPQQRYIVNMEAINRLLQEEKINGIQAVQARLKEYETYNDTLNTFEGGLRSAFASIAQDSLKVGDQVKKTFTNAFSKAEDALVNFVKTGKLDFKSLIDSMIEDLIRLSIKMATMKMFGGGDFGGGSGGGGLFGGLSSLFGGGSSNAIGLTDSSGWVNPDMIGEVGSGGIMESLSSLSSMFAFKKGDVFGYASGDVFSQPTMFNFGNSTGVMGEAGPEAVMPLTRHADGSLGVKAMLPDSGGGNTIVTNITVNMNSNNAGTKEDGQNIAQMIDKHVQTSMQRFLYKQQRTGGMLTSRSV